MPGGVDKPCLTPSLVTASLARRQRRAPGPGLTLSLGERGRGALRPEPLLRPLSECEDSLAGLVSARTPLIEADSDRESCV